MQEKVTENIRYIGVDDTTIDLFEGQYAVPKGISYNSYVILDEKVAVLDTVDHRATGAWEEKLKRELAGRTPDFLIIQHLEPDHAGSIVRLVELYPEMQLVGNAKTFAMLPQFFDFSLEGRTLTVKEGDMLSLGSHRLTFVMAPMVHWPEVMVTYEATEKILFSADGFGTFGALGVTTEEAWLLEARRYYFNIVGKFGAAVQALLKKAVCLDIQCICPLHGPVLRKKPEYYFKLYDTWSSYQPEEEGVLIAYATLHGNTAVVAERLAGLFREQGETVAVYDLARSDRSEVIADAFRYDRMIVAAASYDGGVMPCMYDFLHHLQTKAYQKRRVAVIENTSWIPTAGRVMQEQLEAMKEVAVRKPIITIRSILKAEDMDELRQLVTDFSA